MEYTQEEIQALEAKAAQVDVLSAELITAKENVTSTVEELKVLRTKKQELEDIAKAALEGKGSGEDIEAKARQIVKTMLDEEKSTKIEMTRSEFEAKFKASNPEFLQANDPAGIKFEAFKKVLGRFNTNGLSSQDEFATVYGDALTLMTGIKQSTYKESSPYAFSPVSRSGIAEVVDGDLSPTEKKLIDDNSWTKERYLKLKNSQPQYVRQLLNQVIN